MTENIENTNKKSKRKLKLFFWFLFIAIWVFIIKIVGNEYRLIATVAFLAFLPFFDRIIKAFFPKKDSKKILGVKFNEFVTPWIMFLGLSGIVISYKQAQDYDKEQRRQTAIEERKERDKEYYMYVDNLKHSNEGNRIDAIENLYKLAYEYPSERSQKVCEVFCSHIREITSDSIYQTKNSNKPPKDIQNIIDLLLKNDKDSLIFNRFWKNLKGSYLNGADFQNAKLNSVDFIDATLSNADFRLAFLNNVTFISDAKNHDINFGEAELSNVDFRNNKLTKVNFKKSKINRVIFKNTRLSDINFEDAYLNEVNFDESVMIRVSFRNDTLINVSFRKDTLQKVYFQNSIINKGIFRNASINDVNFDNAEFYVANFNDSKLTDVYFKKTKLKDTSFRQVTYKNVDFNDARFYNVDFYTGLKIKKEEIFFQNTKFENDLEKIFTKIGYSQLTEEVW